jgi:hypothetical protein
MRISDIIMIVAVLAGPVLAVQAQAFIERRREKRERRLRLFRTLMATRARKAAEPSHVEALNLVSIEFYDVNGVREAFNLYIDHLTSGPTNAAWATRMDDLFLDLIYKMAKCLGYDFDKVQIKRQSYSPVLYENREKDELAIKQGIIGVLTGKVSIPIHSGGQPYVIDDLPNPMASIAAPDDEPKP